MCGARGHRNGKTRTSLSTTTMPRLTGPLKFCSFWPRTTWQWSPIPHTHPIWPPVTLLFPKLKLRLKGRRFDTIEEIQEELQRVLDTIRKRDFQGCFQAWQKRWDHCIRAKGEYLTVMEEFNIQGKQTSFYKYCPGTFGYTIVLPSLINHHQLGWTWPYTVQYYSCDDTKDELWLDGLKINHLKTQTMHVCNTKMKQKGHQFISTLLLQYTIYIAVIFTYFYHIISILQF